MKKNKILLTILLITISFFFFGCGRIKNESKYTIISTSFPGFDFSRAIVEGTDIDVKMLLKPGSEMHHYEPTPQDIIDIEKSDLFIYVGGDSDSWIDEVLSNINTDKVKIVKLMDLVELVKEEKVVGMEGEDSFEDDEHVWTSPRNAKIIIEKLREFITDIDKDNSDTYLKNANNYISKIEAIDSEIKDIISSSKRKEIIFGDRFPLRYFADYYGLDYYAAFPGCSEQTEASAKTIAFLIDKVKSDKIPVIFKIELSNGKIAETIANETGIKVLEFHSAHNISQDDFDKGLTYVDIMKKNSIVLKEALN